MQDASLTYQQFKNCRDNLSSWLEHLPRNQVRPSDGPSQIDYKLQAQKVSEGAGLRGPAESWSPCGLRLPYRLRPVHVRLLVAMDQNCSKRPQTETRHLQYPIPHLQRFT